MEKDTPLSKISMNIKPRTVIIFAIPIVLLLSLFAFASFDGFTASRDIEVVNIEGKTVSTADYRGKIQFIEFFETWCPTCKDIAKNVASYHSKYNFTDVIFWTVSTDSVHDQPEVIQNYINDNGLAEFVDERTWIFARDLKDYHKLFNVDGIPYSFLMDQDGNLVNIGKNGETGRLGAISLAEIEGLINDLR